MASIISSQLFHLPVIVSTGRSLPLPFVLHCDAVQMVATMMATPMVICPPPGAQVTGYGALLIIAEPLQQYGVQCLRACIQYGVQCLCACIQLQNHYSSMVCNVFVTQRAVCRVLSQPSLCLCTCVPAVILHMLMQLCLPLPLACKQV
jgi:hypothetical protein